MTDNYQIGRMICLVSYVLLGLTVIVFSVINGVDNRQTAVFTAVTWLAGFVILHVTNGSEDRIRRRFCILNSLFTTIFEMQLCILFRTPHILFMMFLVQWIATVFFLDRTLCTYMLFIDLVIVVVLSRTPIPFFTNFTVVEFTGATIGLILAYWISVWMIRTMDHQHKILLEQEQSLKDFLKVLELKCDELSRVRNGAIPVGEIPFPEVEGVDWEFALRHTSDAGLLADIVRDAIVMKDAERQKLSAFKNKGDVEQYRIQVHSMKNTAAMVGAHDVAALARLLEQSARKEDRDQIERLHDLFLTEWDALFERLQPVFRGEEAKPEQKKKLPYDRTIVDQLLSQLCEAVTDVDVDRGDNLMNCLLQYNFPRDQWENLSLLKQAVTGIDEDEVNRLASLLTATDHKDCG